MAMNDLPHEIEEEIFKKLAQNAVSTDACIDIAQLQRVSRKYASDQFLWRLLVTSACPSYKPPANISIDELKQFVHHLPREQFLRLPV